MVADLVDVSSDIRLGLYGESPERWLALVFAQVSGVTSITSVLSTWAVEAIAEQVPELWPEAMVERVMGVGMSDSVWALRSSVSWALACLWSKCYGASVKG